MARLRASGRSLATCSWVIAAVLIDIAAAQAPAKSNAETNRPSSNEVDAFGSFFTDKVFLLVEDFGRFAGGLENADRIVVPIKQLQKFLDRELSQARRGGIAATVTSLDIVGELRDDRVDLEVVATIRATVANAMASLEFREANCRSAVLDSKAIPILERDPNSGYRIVVPTPGDLVLRMGLTVDAPRAPGGRRCALTLPHAAVKQAVVRSRGDLAALVAAKRELPATLSDDRRSARLTLKPDDSIDFTWRMATDVDPLALAGGSAAVETTVRWQEAAVESSFVCDLSLPPDKAQLTIALAPGERILAIDAEADGVPLTTRRLPAKTGAENEIILALQNPMPSSLRLRIASQRPLTLDAPMEGIGQIAFKEAARVSGQIRVERNRNRPVRLSPTGSAIRLPTVSIDGDPARRTLQAAYRFDAAPAGITVVCPRVKPLVAARCDTTVVAGAARAQLRAKIQLTVRNGAIDSARIALPVQLENLEIAPSDAFVVQQAPHGPPESQAVEWTISLAEPTRGDVDLQLSGTLPATAGVRRIFVPAIIGATDAQSSIALSSDEATRVLPVAAACQNIVRTRPPDPSIGGARRLHFRAEAPNAAIGFETAAVPLVREASVAASVRFDRRQALIHLTYDVRANRAAIDRLTLNVPAGVANVSVRIDDRPYSAPIRAGKNDVILDDPSAGCKLVVDYATERAAGDWDIPLATIDVDRLVLFGVELKDLPADAFIADGRWRTDPSGKGDRLTLADGANVGPIELRFAANAPRSIAWIVAAEHAVVLHGDGIFTVRSRFAIDEMRGDALTATFAPNCANLRCFVDGRPANMSVVDRGVSISLPGGAGRHALEFHYDVALGRSLAAADSLELGFQRFVEPIQMGNVRWIVHAPSNRRCIGAGANASPTEALRSLLRGRRNAVERPMDWFESQGQRLTWASEADARNAASALSPGRVWMTVRYGDGAERIDVVVVYDPLWILLTSGGLLSAAGIARLLSPAGRWRLAALGIPLAAFLAVEFPDWLWPTAEGAVWGAAVLAIAGLRGGLAAWRRTRAAAKPPASPASARRGSSLVVTPAPASAHPHGRVASTVDQPLAKASLGLPESSQGGEASAR